MEELLQLNKQLKRYNRSSIFFPKNDELYNNIIDKFDTYLEKNSKDKLYFLYIEELHPLL